MWVTEDVKLDDSILEAQYNGNLVIFAGAGVSMGGSSNLPNFFNLAEQVGTHLVEDLPSRSTPIDYYLGKIERRGSNIHNVVKRLIDKDDSQPNQIHKNIVNLFKHSGVRIVTTNFDDHFRKSLRHEGLEGEVYTAPALPLGKNFNGIVHLHGSITQNSKELIVTDSDFGRAYLTEGWARQFLIDLFVNNTVLFIGYSHDDSILKYLGMGLPPNTNRYALSTVDDDKEKWDHLGIKVCEYSNLDGDHRKLHELIEKWAKQTSWDINTEESVIQEITENKPPVEKSKLSIIKNSLKTVHGTRFFVQNARHYEWVEWLENENFLEFAFSRTALDNERNNLLIKWLVSNFIESNNEDIFHLIFKNYNSLSPRLWIEICSYIASSEKKMSSELLIKWVEVLRHTIPHNTRCKEEFSELLSKCILPNDQDALMLLLDTILTPHSKLNKKLLVGDERQVEFEISLDLGNSNYTLQQNWINLIKPNLEVLAHKLFPLLQSKWYKIAMMQKSNNIEGTFDRINFNRSAIEPHEQDDLTDDFDLMIDITRDVFEHLAQNGKNLVSCFCQTISTCESLLLKRMGIHAMNHLASVSSSNKVTWLLDNDLIFMHELKHEIYMLLKEHYSNIGIDLKKKLLREIKNKYKLEEKVISDEDELLTHTGFKLIFWLHKMDKECKLTKEEFDGLNARFPNYQVGDYPDLNHYSFGFVGSKSSFSEKDILEMDLVKDIDKLLEYKGDESIYHSRDALLSNIQKATLNDFQWSINLSNVFLEREIYNTDIWCYILMGWEQNTDLSDYEWNQIFNLALNKIIEKNEHTHLYLARILREFSRNVEDRETGLIQKSENIGFSIITNLKNDETEPKYENIMSKAINDPAGVLTYYFIYMLSHHQSNESSFPIQYKSLFSEICSVTTNNKQIMKVILAEHLAFLYSIDEKWCERYLVPLFDFEVKATARYVWTGFLFNPGLNVPLISTLKPYFIQVINDLNLLNKELRSRFCDVIALITIEGIFYEIDRLWLNQFVKKPRQQDLINYLTSIKSRLDKLTLEQKQLVHKYWLEKYIQLRIDLQNATDKEVIELIQIIIELNVDLDKYISKITEDFKEVHFDYEALNFSFIFRKINKNDQLLRTNTRAFGELLYYILKRMHYRFYDKRQIFSIISKLELNDIEKELLTRIQNEIKRIGIK